MLGYEDIVRELGKNISVFPFNEKNIKGDALNLTVSEFAWSLSEEEIWLTESGEAYLDPPLKGTDAKRYVIKARESAMVKYEDQKYVAILPNSTTLVETQEVISVSNRIGGTYHSKVSIVSKGICHIGTYLEPNYKGHSLIALHNPGNKIILLPVGTIFAAITFFYLKTTGSKPRLGASGSRFDILTQCGIHVSETAKNYLAEQWKNDSAEIARKMQESKDFIRFKNAERKRKWKRAAGYLNLRNIVITIFMIVVLFGLHLVAFKVDQAAGNTIWMDRFWNVGCSGVLVSFILLMFGFMKKD